VERELELSYPPLDDLATPDPRRSFGLGAMQLDTLRG
jgi:hypothetical protein